MKPWTPKQISILVEGAKYLMSEHQQIEDFRIGFSPHGECTCPTCIKLRELFEVTK